VLGPGVESCGGLVEDDEGGVAEEGPGQGHTLPLTDGQLGAPEEGSAEQVS